jgi:hypothetical protein
MFAVPVFIGVMVMLYCFLNGLYYMENTKFIYKLVALIIIPIDLAAYLYTLFGNQGIPDELFTNEFVVTKG